jgi:hypothetical protein
LITRQRRHLVGHDILLARHGNHICSMRVDRGNGCVVALLDDGSIDTAPNLISPGLRLPDTFHTVLREDWKLLAALSALAIGVGVLIMVAAWTLAGTSLGDGTAQTISTYASF